MWHEVDTCVGEEQPSAGVMEDLLRKGGLSKISEYTTGKKEQVIHCRTTN